MSNLISSWNSEKPVAGNIAPEEALASLLSFETRFRNAESEYNTVAKAKEALDLHQSPPNPVLPLLDELQDFKSVWTALSKIWESLRDLRDTLWTSVVPRKVRQNLDGLVAITKDMPSRMRQYSAFEYVQGVLQKLIKINPLLSELKSDAIKERHWTKIFKSCRSREKFLPSTLNLGIIWDLDLAANETVLREVIVQAQGEMALEEYLRQVFIPSSSSANQAGQRNMDELHPRPCQLSEQMSIGKRMGRLVCEMWRKPQLSHGDEILTILQSLRGRCLSLGRSIEQGSRYFRYLD